MIEAQKMQKQNLAAENKRLLAENLQFRSFSRASNDQSFATNDNTHLKYQSNIRSSVTSLASMIEKTPLKSSKS